jgi:putative photosynthetic complex assembly protein
VSDPFARRPFPRGPLLGAGALIAAALVSVTLVRITGVSYTQPSAGALVARDLRFIDRGDGGVTVYDARSEQPIQIVPPGTNGFLRATLRGLARDRKRAGAGDEEPFRLTALADGRLTLEDPVTGHRVDLEAFGVTNAGVFANLLASRSNTP